MTRFRSPTGTGPESRAGWTWLLQDWSVNAGNPKGRLVLVLFRLAQRAATRRGPLGLAYLGWYRLVVSWVLGVEIDWNASIGPRVRLWHGQSLVVHPSAVIGSDITLRHSTTIGEKALPDGTTGAPVIGDRVDIGPGVIVIGAVHVGDGATLGAGAVVTRDVPPGAIVVGNPARTLPTSRDEGAS